MFKKIILAALVAAPLCLSAQVKLGYVNSQEICTSGKASLINVITLTGKHDLFKTATICKCISTYHGCPFCYVYFF